MDRNIFEEGKCCWSISHSRWTSFDAVRKIRNLIRIKNVGMAHLIRWRPVYSLSVPGNSQAYQWVYGAGKNIPAASPWRNNTYVWPGKRTRECKPFDHITTEQIKAATEKFTGEIMQVPPAHSAIKQDGKEYMNWQGRVKKWNLNQEK